jgi:hypothetical protein
MDSEQRIARPAGLSTVTKPNPEEGQISFREAQNKVVLLCSN